MQTIASLTDVLTPTIVALGNFDGIHRGHLQVIQPILTRNFNPGYPSNGASSKPASPVRPYSTVVTFTPHPQEFFTGRPKTLLTPIPEKMQYLTELGVEQLVLLPFNRELANLSALDFVKTILFERLQVQGISIGQDFRFGVGRTGTAQNLKEIAHQSQIPVHITPLQFEGQERISSSAIRQALLTGKLDQANGLLGRPYTLEGKVVKGQQLGRTIGFATANLKLPANKFLPHHGVYGVWVRATPGSGLSQLQPGVMNLGMRPTVSGQTLTLEVHLFDWSGDLYGHQLQVQLDCFIRPEQKFTSLEDLKAQIARDCQTAKQKLGA